MTPTPPRDFLFRVVEVPKVVFYSNYRPTAHCVDGYSCLANCLSKGLTCHSGSIQFRILLHEQVIIVDPGADNLQHLRNSKIATGSHDRALFNRTTLAFGLEVAVMPAIATAAACSASADRASLAKWI
jgi:hypothetical protein